MSKLLCTVTFYRSSTWLQPYVGSLLESPIAELSLESGLFSISIPQDQGKTSGPKKKEPRYKCQSYYVQFAFYRSSTWPEPTVESLLESPIAELSLDSGLFSISIPQDQGKCLVHQAQPVYLARLSTTGRSPGIPEGAGKDRLTHCHSFLRHGTHTLGLGIVFQGLLL